MGSLTLVKPNLHLVDVEERRMLFHVPTSSLFELDDLGRELIELFTSEGEVSAPQIRERFDGRFSAGDVVEIRAWQAAAVAGSGSLHILTYTHI